METSEPTMTFSLRWPLSSLFWKIRAYWPIFFFVHAHVTGHGAYERKRVLLVFSVRAEGIPEVRTCTHVSAYVRTWAYAQHVCRRNVNSPTPVVCNKEEKMLPTQSNHNLARLFSAKWAREESSAHSWAILPSLP